MKIVAHVGSHHVLAEVSVDELAHIMGFVYRHEIPDYSRTRDESSKCFHIGQVVEVSKLWDIIKHERSRPGEVAVTIRNLRSIADLLENVNKALPTPPSDQPPQSIGS